MHICINCGKRSATRTVNSFACEACGYVWDVAFEQRMAHYLAAQGRKPAEPVPEPDASAAPETLVEFAHLQGSGLWSVLDPVGFRDEYHTLIADRYTVADLQAIADEHGVLITSTKKADVMDALIDAGVFEVHETILEDGTAVTALAIGGVIVPFDEEESGEAEVED
ncbi:MAG: hypothetical protein WCZ87_00305 [Thiohalobacteraceae bacterium]